ncbi:MAG: PAS domain-containing protein, partial [Clostridia bacterium]
MEGIEVFQRFCAAYLERRNVGEVVSLLTPDIVWVGASAYEEVCGLHAVERLLQKEMEQDPVPWKIEWSDCNQNALGEGGCILSTRLRAIRQDDSQWGCAIRLSCALRRVRDILQVCMVHASVAIHLQTEKESSPISFAAKKVEEVKMTLLNDAVMGGMIGRYLDEGYPFCFINDRMLSYLGYESKQDFVRDIDGHIVRCMHPDDIDAVRAQIDEQLAMQPDYHIRYRMRKKDRSYIWVYEKGRRMIAEDGRPAVIGVCLDVTEEHERTVELQQQADYIRKLYQTMPCGITQCAPEPNARLLDANHAAIRMFGFDEEAFWRKPRHFSDFMRPEDIADMAPTMQKMLTLPIGSVVSSDYPIHSATGHVLWLHDESQQIVDMQGKRVILSVLTDLTEQKQAEMELAARAEKADFLDSLIQTEAGGFFRANMSDYFTIEYANEYYYTMHGYTQAQFERELHNSVVSLLAPEAIREMGRQVQAYCASSIDSLVFEYTIARRDGQTAYMRTGATIKQIDGQWMMIGLVTDVTEQKRTALLLERQNAEITQIYNSIPGGVFRCKFHEDWTVTFSNDGLFRFLGYTREAFQTLFGNKLSGVIYPDDLQKMMVVVSGQLQDGS